jgi:hypothetical protein
MTDKKQTKRKPSICENCGHDFIEHKKDDPDGEYFHAYVCGETLSCMCTIYAGSKFAKRMRWE